MSKETMTLAEIRAACNITEEMGFDAPFVTFTWDHWQVMQARMVQGFTHFQRAVENRRPQAAAMIALEMQQMIMDLQKEVCALIETKPL